MDRSRTRARSDSNNSQKKCFRWTLYQMFVIVLGIFALYLQYFAYLHYHLTNTVPVNKLRYRNGDTNIIVTHPSKSDLHFSGSSFVTQWIYSGKLKRRLSMYLYKGPEFIQLLGNNLHTNSRKSTQKLSSLLPAGSDYRVRVFDPVTETSNLSEPFTIQQRGLVVTQPHSQSTLVPGSELVVQWSASGLQSCRLAIQLFLGADLLATVSELEMASVGHTRFTLDPIRMRPGSGYWVKVMDHMSGVSNSSEFFSLQEQKLMVTRPSSSDSFVLGGHLYIGWTVSVPVPGYMTMELYKGRDERIHTLSTSCLAMDLLCVTQTSLDRYLVDRNNHYTVKVTDQSTLRSNFSEPFSFRYQTIIVSRPNASDNYFAGDRLYTAWFSKEVKVDYVTIDLFKGQNLVQQFVEQEPNENSWDYTTLNEDLIDGADYRVKVKDHSTGLSNFSAPFTIHWASSRDSRDENLAQNFSDKSSLTVNSTSKVEKKKKNVTPYLKYRGISGIMIPRGRFVVAALNIQKTGSTLFNAAFCDAMKAIDRPLQELGKTLANVGGPDQSDNHHLLSEQELRRFNKLLRSNRGRIGLFSFECGSSGGLKVGKHECIHHGDISHLDQCLEKRFGLTVFLTILRDPVQRLISEFLHLDGNVMNGHKGSWRIFQPKICPFNGSEPYVHQLKQSKVDLYLQERNEMMLTLKEPTDKYRLEGDRLKMFKDWVKLGAANPANNRMARHLAGPYPCVEDPSSVSKSVLFNETWMVQSAMKNLEDRVYFGLQHEYYSSILLINAHLMQLFGNDTTHDYLRKNFLMNPQFTSLNINAKKNVSQTYSVDNEALDIIGKYNKMDLKLFNNAVKLFYRREKQLNTSMEYIEVRDRISQNQFQNISYLSKEEKRQQKNNEMKNVATSQHQESKNMTDKPKEEKKPKEYQMKEGKSDTPQNELQSITTDDNKKEQQKVEKMLSSNNSTKNTPKSLTEDKEKEQQKKVDKALPSNDYLNTSKSLTAEHKKKGQQKVEKALSSNDSTKTLKVLTTEDNKKEDMKQQQEVEKTLTTNDFQKAPGATSLKQKLKQQKAAVPRNESQNIMATSKEDKKQQQQKVDIKKTSSPKGESKKLTTRNTSNQEKQQQEAIEAKISISHNNKFKNVTDSSLKDKK